MKILIIGSNGQLGWELCQRGKPHGFDIIPLDIPEFDITDPAAVKKAVNQPGISLVINAAAYTAVDKAESEPESAFAINCDGPADLAASCNEADIPLIHISTDYVFDGTREEPYLETDPLSPLGVYGKSKAEGETIVRSLLTDHIIIRTAWLYGIHGNNFVKTMLSLGKEKETLRVVADQYGCPTSAADLAEAILTIAEQIKERPDIHWGTYHYCGKGKTTWHGFAEKIFELAKQYNLFSIKKVIPVTTAEYPTPAKRPLNSVMDCSLLTKNFGILPPPWQESLERMLRQLYKPPNP
ncbi:MAG: dTDP-4-dehydrorhamnose reductase [Deltaproteobacteria bacterium]|nr:dTDP-4-dehydrorhamnose reductase [Deltaproteobacteria bacterium]